MTPWLAYAAFGWMALSGTMHFIIDVAAQYLRGKRPPGAEATLYYGLNSAYALGQLLFGLICLWLVRRHAGALAEWPVAALALVSAAGWMAISLAFMEYREPKANAALVLVLTIAAIMTTQAPE